MRLTLQKQDGNVSCAQRQWVCSEGGTDNPISQKHPCVCFSLALNTIYVLMNTKFLYLARALK